MMRRALAFLLAFLVAGPSLAVGYTVTLAEHGPGAGSAAAAKVGVTSGCYASMTQALYAYLPEVGVLDYVSFLGADNGDWVVNNASPTNWYAGQWNECAGPPMAIADAVQFSPVFASLLGVAAGSTSPTPAPTTGGTTDAALLARVVALEASVGPAPFLGYPEADDFAAAWSAGFVLPMVLGLVAFSIAAVLNLVRQRS